MELWQQKPSLVLVLHIWEQTSERVSFHGQGQVCDSGTGTKQVLIIHTPN